MDGYTSSIICYHCKKECHTKGCLQIGRRRVTTLTNHLDLVNSLVLIIVYVYETTPVEDGTERVLEEVRFVLNLLEVQYYIPW